MQKPAFALQILLCMCLFAPVVQAQETTVPDKAHRQGMSYEEYSKFREKMRQHMEKVHSSEAKQSPDENGSPQDKRKMRHQDSAYGQGYRSRVSEDRPDTGRDSRPEHPQRVERIERGDMGRRQ